MSIDNHQQVVVVANNITDRKNAELKLIESEEKFRNIAQNSLAGIFIYQEYYVYANNEFSNITGYTTNELYKLKPWELSSDKYIQQAKEIVRKRLNGEKFPKDYKDIEILTKDNQTKIVRVTTQTIKYQGNYAGMGTIMDVTDIKKTKKQVQLLSKAVEQMDELIRITDKDGIITFVNDALVAHTGYKRVELIGENVNIFKSGEHDKSFFENLWNTILSGKTFKSVFINRKKDKSIYYEEETITPIYNHNGEIEHFVATSQDISERIKTEKQLQKLATLDSLTGIYNRYKTNEELDIEIGRVKRYHGNFGLLMIDIDHFKDINDTYGHDIGDYVLQEFASVISKHIRESDRFGRWGGEEFIIILPDSDRDSIIKFAKKLNREVESHKFKDIEKMTISLGCTIYKKEQTKEELLKNVDKALYKAKKDGRNTVKII